MRITPFTQWSFPFIVLIIFLLVGLTISVLIDPYIHRDQRTILMTIAILVITLVCQNFLEDLIASGRPMPEFRTVVAIYGYSVRPLLLAMFIRLIDPERPHLFLWVTVAVNALIHLTALFSPVCFSIDQSNHWHGGPLKDTCLIISLAMLIILLTLSIRRYGRSSNPLEKWLPHFIMVSILLSVALDSLVRYQRQPVTYLTVSIATGSVFFYIWLHLKYVKEHEEDLIAGQRAKIMIAQIQPHFLYNSLSVIRSICGKDPEEAEKAITSFTEYLRYNMDSLTVEELIPFSKELEHIKRYLELQQLRFQDDLRVEYDLECIDFSIPCLSIQPLVENAVSWGIRRSETGSGVVMIRTRNCGDHYEVSVIDNGAGFVPGKLPEDKSRSHIGISNVRERLQSICGGELKIISAPGEGTAATVILPRESVGKAC